MTDRDPSHHRAKDPGGRLASFGQVTWVHCPKCDAAAKSDRNGVTCAHCGYMTIQDTAPYSNRWARLGSDSERCRNCRKPLGQNNRPTARDIDGKLHVRVRCGNCDQTFDYPASPGWAEGTTSYPERNRLYLQTQVAGETLWVDNLAHLDALEDWLGARLRERGPVAGLTMMARLPRWMKASTNREKVLRGLSQLRERAEKAGIDE